MRNMNGALRWGSLINYALNNQSKNKSDEAYEQTRKCVIVTKKRQQVELRIDGVRMRWEFE